MERTNKILLLLALLAFFALDCEKPSLVGPNAHKNPRLFTYTIDSLADIGNTMYRVWASGPNNLYAVGTGGSNGASEMWHFDGTHWKEIRLGVADGGPVSNIFTLNNVFGFAPNNIWAVGAHLYYNPTPTTNFDFRSMILHFNGQSWTEDPTNAGAIQCIGGRSPTDLWAGGWNGHMLHYDGISWTKDSVAYRFPDSAHASFHSITSSPTRPIFASAYSHNNTTGYDAHYLFERGSVAWELVDSSQSSSLYISYVWMSPSGSLYGTGQSVYRWTGSSWTLVHSTGLDHSLYHLFGSDDNNIFAVGYGGAIAHFNGIDWYVFPDLGANQIQYFTTGWTDGSEVFFLGSTKNIRTVILHGK